jgi:hypothetical protein
MQDVLSREAFLEGLENSRRSHEKRTDLLLGLTLCLIATLMFKTRGTPKSMFVYWGEWWSIFACLGYGLGAFVFPTKWKDYRTPFISCAKIIGNILMEIGFSSGLETHYMLAAPPKKGQTFAVVMNIVSMFIGSRLLLNTIINIYIYMTLEYHMFSNLALSLSFLWHGQNMCSTTLLSDPTSRSKFSDVQKAFNIISLPGSYLTLLPIREEADPCLAVYFLVSIVCLFIMPAFIICRAERRNECFKYAVGYYSSSPVFGKKAEMSKVKEWFLWFVYPGGDPSHYVAVYLLCSHVWLACCLFA